MQGRTFFRTMLDIVLSNAVFKAITALVNFCNEVRYFNKKELKFYNKMPIKNMATEKYYENRFIFNSINTNRTGSK